MKKQLLGLLMLAITSVLISTVNSPLLASELPNTNNTASLLTYNNTAYGISIQYPSDWQIDESLHQYMLSYLQNLSSSGSQSANEEQSNGINSKISEVLDAFGLESISDVFDLNPDIREEFLQKLSQLLSEGSTQVVVAVVSPFDESDTFVENLNVIVANISESSPISLDEYVNANIEGLKTYVQDLTIEQPPTEITVDGNPAMTLVYTGRTSIDPSINGKFLNLFLINNNTAYVLTFSAIPESFPIYLPTIEKMLQSFRISN